MNSVTEKITLTSRAAVRLLGSERILCELHEFAGLRPLSPGRGRRSGAYYLRTDIDAALVRLKEINAPVGQEVVNAN